MSLAMASLPLSDIMHQVEGFEQDRRHRRGAIEAGPTLLQALDHQHADGGLTRSTVSTGLRTGDSRQAQGHAEGSNLAVGKLSFREESVAIADDQVLACALGCVPRPPVALVVPWLRPLFAPSDRLWRGMKNSTTYRFIPELILRYVDKCTLNRQPSCPGDRERISVNCTLRCILGLITDRLASSTA